MFGDILDIFSGYNLLMPLMAFFEDFRPHTEFGVALLAGKTKYEVRQVLNKAGVVYWGDMDNPEGYTIIFNVAKGQERQAHAALTEAEIPVIYPKLDGDR